MQTNEEREKENGVFPLKLTLDFKTLDRQPN